MAKKDQKAAIAEVIAAAAPAAAAVEQLELMPAMRPSLTDSQVERVETAIKADRRGRPPGAQNKATREMLEFVRKLCGDPLERRFRYAMHTPETLAIELGCTKLEAFDRLDRMWSELGRYFYAQMAQVDAGGNSVAPRLTMVFPGQSAPAIGPDGSTRAPWLYIEQREENQALSAPADDVSHSDVSHGDDK
ncbi:hypothetical protein QWJ07_31345 [Frankia sp. RB7]|nr:hypothetical protein [Frankia sp. RB7]